jgi:hypothetical protein
MEAEKQSHLFFSLVYMFQMQGMIQLGKVANPVDGSTNTDLEAAQVTIDLLDMIKAKSANNLTDDEKRFLDQALSDLKLNFVDEKNKQKPAEEKSPDENTEQGKAENPSP